MVATIVANNDCCDYILKQIVYSYFQICSCFVAYILSFWHISIQCFITKHLENIRKPDAFWRFHEVQKWNIGLKYLNLISLNVIIDIIFLPLLLHF